MGHVLVVGADGSLLDGLRGTGLLGGHELLAAVGPLDAVCQARRLPIDVVVTDPKTPMAEDLALVEEIKAVRHDARLIVLAPQLTDADVLTALRANVFGCFTIPYSHIEVAEMTRSALEATNWSNGIEVVSGLPNWMTLRVACRILTADRLTRFMTEWRGDMPSEERDLLMAAFRELLLNAMEHGAGFDPGKTIQVTAARTARAIVFHFRDPGDGFDRTDLHHAVASNDRDSVMAAASHREEAGLRAGGFGLLIARQVVDELVYNEKGNEVLMIKHVR